jgi:hypothetical protein
MTDVQQQKIKELIVKYNDILLVSMRLAIADDFINLMVLNRDDSGFILKDLFNNKDEFNKLIMKEFFKKNRISVVDELKFMDNSIPNFQHFLKKKSKSMI